MFGQSAERSFNFESTAYTEALNRLLFVVESGEPFVSLAAPEGTGKSTVLGRAAGECHAQRAQAGHQRGARTVTARR